MSLYSPKADPKYQWDAAPTPDLHQNSEPNTIADKVTISPDTLRAERLPPGQFRTRKWPVLHATTVPQIDQSQWTLTLTGLLSQPTSFTLDEFQRLPRSKVFADFHCVTKWSRLGNLWEGVRLSWLLQQHGLHPEAKYLTVAAYDGQWTTNIPLREAMADDVLLASHHDGEPLSPDHGGPVRLVVPRLFAWKSAKWVRCIHVTTDNEPGYWEQKGYHDVGDPWTEQRFRD